MNSQAPNLAKLQNTRPRVRDISESLSTDVLDNTNGREAA